MRKTNAVRGTWLHQQVSLGFRGWNDRHEWMSDKVYHMSFTQQSRTFEISVSYGKRTGYLQTKVLYRGPDRARALAIFERKLDRKLGKGYQISGTLSQVR